MKLQQHKFFSVDDEKKVSVYRDFWEWVILQGEVLLNTDKFLEYQKDLFNEFFSELIDFVSPVEEITVKKLKSGFEEKLQWMNTKLSTFSEKIKDVERFEIKWVVQIFYNGTYISSMIGDVSTVIFRNSKLNYLVDNDFSKEDKIDTFTDFLEWDLENNDRILCVGTNLTEIFVKDEIQEYFEESEDLEWFINNFKENISSRINEDDIFFILLNSVEFETVIDQQNVKEKILSSLKYTQGVKEFLVRFRYPIAVTIGFLFVFYLLYTMVTSFIGSSTNEVVEVDWEQVTIDYDIEDIEEEIGILSNMESGPEREQKYQSIDNKLTALEDLGRWSHDVEELRHTLDEVYYDWFDVVIIDDVSWNKIFEFEEEEIENIWEILSVYYDDWLMIGGDEWAMLNIVNEEARGTTVEYDLPVFMDWCSLNLVRDWLYCFSEDWDIINVTNGWIETVTTDSDGFYSGIKDVNIYWESRIYTLIDNEEVNQQGSIISMYSNKPGSQTEFWVENLYDIDPDALDQYQNAIEGGVTNLAIDGSFLTWSKERKEIFQFRRNADTWYLEARSIDRVGEAGTEGEYSEEVDVLTYEWSDYVYLFDNEKQTFTAYVSENPQKTTPWREMEYDLRHFFTIDFNLDEQDIESAFVDSWENPILYLVTGEGILRYNLPDFFEEFTW